MRRTVGAFTLETETVSGFVKFGILGSRVWVTCETLDRESSMCSLDSSRAVHMAARWLEVGQWPAFASSLVPKSNNQGSLL